MTETVTDLPDTVTATPVDTGVRSQRATWRERIVPPVSHGSVVVGWLVALAVALLGGALRFVRLAQPPGIMFDELYYACDAQNLLRYGVEVGNVAAVEGQPAPPFCTPNGQGSFIAHPPLGKWMIGLGIRMFGFTEFGWRSMAALAGTLSILAVVRVGRRMTGSTYLGAVAGLVLSLDGLHFVQSRIAMLDIFLALWIVLAFACLVADRDQTRYRLAAAPERTLTGWGPRLGVRGWLLAAGLCLGAGLATKWSAVYALAALGLLAFAWEVGARRTSGARAPLRAVLVRSSVPLALALLVLPAMAYALSWAGWFTTDLGYNRNWAATQPASLLPEAFRSWVDYHRQIFGFHTNLTARHNYQSHPVGWLVLARPVSYYYPQNLVRGQMGCDADNCASEVLAIGNPALWWAVIPMVFGLLFLWLAKRDWRPASVLVMVVIAIAPWQRDDLNDRTMFLFYALPAVPFMALGAALLIGWAVGDRGASGRRRAAGAVFAGTWLSLIALCFIYFYPVLAAVTLPYDSWMDRMWFSSWI